MTLGSVRVMGAGVVVRSRVEEVCYLYLKSIRIHRYVQAVGILSSIRDQEQRIRVLKQGRSPIPADILVDI